MEGFYSIDTRIKIMTCSRAITPGVNICVHFIILHKRAINQASGTWSASVLQVTLNQCFKHLLLVDGI
jgi:hypothetical protein